MKKLQHEKSATGEDMQKKKLQHETSATGKDMQKKKGAIEKEPNTKKGAT